MRKIDKNSSIATEAAVKIVNTLVFDWGIQAEKLFDFLNSRNGYNNLLNDDDILICMMHDNSISDMINLIGEQING